MKRILITGGAGFIGSHLCERLLNEGNEIICLDNFFTGRKQNILHLMDNHRFELVRHDITEPYYAEVDQIYNLACPASPVYYQHDPVKTIKTSVIGSVNMLGLARRIKARILQASTSEVYGDPDVHPQKESYWGKVNPTGIRSCYDEGKRCAETLFTDYHRKYGVDIRIVRIFNTYGERMRPDDGRVISNFIVQALQDQNITVYGSGNQTRSFQFINDLINGLITVMNSEITTPVNIGNPEEYEIIEIAEQVIGMTESRSRITYKELPEDDPQQRCPDITLAKTLGWSPTINLTEGLQRTIRYFKDENIR
jgi:UDP-glucuronate decarboxylase